MSKKVGDMVASLALAAIGAGTWALFTIVSFMINYVTGISALDTMVIAIGAPIIFIVLTLATARTREVRVSIGLLATAALIAAVTVTMTGRIVPGAIAGCIVSTLLFTPTILQETNKPRQAPGTSN